MALTTEELEQIRAMVKYEVQNSPRKGANGFFIAVLILGTIFFAVLALHVLVIGGLIIYHLSKG
jgi:hypothetical protein